MDITPTMLRQAGELIISKGYNGRVKAVAYSLQDKGWFMPTSYPWDHYNVDAFNRPFYTNDNH